MFCEVAKARLIILEIPDNYHVELLNLDIGVHWGTNESIGKFCYIWSIIIFARPLDCFGTNVVFLLSDKASVFCKRAVSPCKSKGLSSVSVVLPIDADASFFSKAVSNQFFF